MPTPLEHSLTCHDATPSSAAQSLRAGAAFDVRGGLHLAFRAISTPDRILLPAEQAPAAADELWQHTCCEAFVATEDGKAYLEFNFSPSRQWAAYRFADYREREADFAPPAAPTINIHPLPDGFLLEARLPPAMLPAANLLHLGLSAVIESVDGHKSYWALRHCAERPDFHLRQSFTLILNRNTP